MGTQGPQKGGSPSLHDTGSHFLEITLLPLSQKPRKHQKKLRHFEVASLLDLELVILCYLTGCWENLPPTIIRLLFSWYKDQKSSVLWNKTLSEKFSVSNGMRQGGGVLSPILFIDELLIRLQSQAVGCHWSHFAGAFGYADDIVLLAPSASALRMMLNICCQFAIDYNLIFNPGKIQLVRFSLPIKLIIQFNYSTHLYVWWSISHAGGPSWSYLTFGSDTDDILRLQTDMCRRANCLLSTFSATNPAVKTLFHTSYLSMALHCGAWRHRVCILWKLLSIIILILLRKIWKLPRNCHTNILPCVSSLQSLHNVIVQRSKLLCLKPLVFHWSVTYSLKHPVCRIPVLATMF
jgi:hypothetical protein